MKTGINSDNNYVTAVNLLIEVAKLGEELWDKNKFRYGSKHINSGLLIDVRKFLSEEEGIDLSMINEQDDAGAT